MKSRKLFEMSTLSIVLLIALPTQIFGQVNQGYGGMGAGGMDGEMGSGSEDAISRPALSYTVDDKPYRATRVRSFRYTYQSFRPKELAYVNYDGGMGMPGGYGAGGMSGGYAGGGMGDGGYGDAVNSDQAPERLAININAFLFDSEQVNDRTRIEYDRTRIELMIEQPNKTAMSRMPGMSGGMPGGGDSAGLPGGYGAGGMPGGFSGESMSGGPPPLMRPFTSLGTPKTKASARLSQPEIKLVTDIICQTIWKADVVKALFASKGQGESAANNEKFLKQLLAEQYDTQLARQELEAESIKRRLELLVDELKRRKLAKERVVDVQLGRLILDAQGLLNNDR